MDTKFIVHVVKVILVKNVSHVHMASMVHQQSKANFVNRANVPVISIQKKKELAIP